MKPPTPIATRPDVPKPRPVTKPGKPPPSPKKPSPNVPAAVLLTDAGEKDRKPGPTTFKKETVAPPKASKKTASVLSSAASTRKAPEAPPAPTNKKTLASGSMPQKATPKLPPKQAKAETPPAKPAKVECPPAKVESPAAKVAKPKISPPERTKAETPPAKPTKTESPPAKVESRAAKVAKPKISPPKPGRAETLPAKPAKVESRPAKPAKVEDQPPRTVKALPPKAKPKAPLKSVKEKAQGLTRVARVQAPTLERARRPVRPGRTAAVRTGRYSVQVAACRTAKCVRWFRNRIKALGLESYIRKSRNRKLTLVQVGSYLTLKEAKAEIERLKKKGFKGPYAVKR